MLLGWTAEWQQEDIPIELNMGIYMALYTEVQVHKFEHIWGREAE